MIEQIFVGRDDEMAILKAALEKATHDQTCQVCLIEGNVGAGKTTLVEQFAQFAEKKYQGKIFVTVGKCNAQTGYDDTYLPFREILNQLTGIQPRLLRGSLSNQPSSWPRIFADGVIQALIEFGPDLIGTFVPGTALLARLASTAVDKSFKKIAESKSGNQEVKEKEVHKQYSEILRKSAKDTTIILIVDDLQWADKASLTLFIHLTKSLKKSSLLIIGTCRTEDKEKHLIDLEHDLQARFGEIILDLGERNREKNEEFTRLFLAANKAEISEEFQAEFFRRTEGNALFSVELFRYLSEHKEPEYLVKNETGYLKESTEMDWEKLPSQIARLEGLIEARFEALSPELRQILDIACIEGQNFTAQVIMHFLEFSEYELLKILKTQLEKRHDLVSEVRETLVGSTVLSNYRFVNATFQQYIYNDMSLGQRRIRHKEVAETLEKLYGVNSSEIAFQLAQHYELSYKSQKVIQYLNLAGIQLARVSDSKAEDVFNKALSLAKITNDRKGHIDAIRYICGSIWIPNGRHLEEAGAQLLEALELTRNIDYIDGEIYILRQLGILARKKNYYTTATRYYIESLNLAKKVEAEADEDVKKTAAKNAQSQAYNNLGTVAMAESAYEDAEEYFKKRLKIADELNNQNSKLYGFINLGDLFWRTGVLASQAGQEDSSKRQWALSKNYFEQALEIGHSIGAKSQIASVEKGLGDLATFEKDYVKAKTHLQKSLSIVIDSEITSKFIRNLFSVAILLHRCGESHEAILFACFVATNPSAEAFEKEIVNGIINDIRIHHQSINIDEIIEDYLSQMGDKHKKEVIQKELIRKSLDLMQTKDV